LKIEGVMPIQIPSHEEVHAAYQQGEEAVIALFDQMAQMAQTILLLAERVQALEDRLAKNSHNSGKPPSSDGLSKPAPKSLRTPALAGGARERHGKKSGGQPGHAGNTLKAVSDPDRVEVHRVQRC